MPRARFASIPLAREVRVPTSKPTSVAYLAPVVLATLVVFSALPASLVAETPPKAVRVGTVADLEGGTGGLTVTPDGTVYSSEFGNWLGALPEGESRGGTRVFRITPRGEVSVLASVFQGASGSAVTADGVFLQANIGGRTISRVDLSTGEVGTLVASGLRNPVGVEVDADGTVWVADCGGQSVVRVVDGKASSFASGDLFKCPNGITRAADGNLYVANFFDGSVLRIGAGGQVSRLAQVPGGNNGHLIAGHGALWVVARAAHQIYRVSLDGEVTLVAGSGEQGGRDGAPEDAQFSLPNDLGWSPDGKVLYVNEVADHTSSGQKLYPTRLRRIVFE